MSKNLACESKAPVSFKLNFPAKFITESSLIFPIVSHLSLSSLPPTKIIFSYKLQIAFLAKLPKPSTVHFLVSFEAPTAKTI